MGNPIRPFFENFDLIFGMDHENVANCQSLANRNKGDAKAEIAMMMAWAGLGDKEIPDPYYHGGFPYVFGLIETASEGLLEEIKTTHLNN